MKSLSLLFLALPLTASAYTFDTDVPQAIRDQITTDMAFMGTIQGTDVTPLHKQIYGNVDGKAYTSFFIDRVKSVGLDDCGSPKAVACVKSGWFADSSKIYLTDNYTKFSHPQIAKMMVVFHEGRHTEDDNGNWPHANCPDPFTDAAGKDMTSILTGATLAGEPACDKTPFGSYGSTVIMLKNIEKFCSNCTAKVKADAGIYGDDQFGRIIDKKAIASMKKDLYPTAKKKKKRKTETET